jgi:hypothetical protein
MPIVQKFIFGPDFNRLFVQDPIAETGRNGSNSGRTLHCITACHSWTSRRDDCPAAKSPTSGFQDDSCSFVDGHATAAAEATNQLRSPIMFPVQRQEQNGNTKL